VDIRRREPRERALNDQYPEPHGDVASVAVFALWVYRVDADQRERQQCAECGLGRTSVPSVGAVDLSPEARAANGRVRALMDQFTGPTSEFTDVAFVPYGVDEWWTGLRGFGGSAGSGSAVTQLVLAFSDARWDMDWREVRIATRRADLQSCGDPTAEAQFVGGNDRSATGRASMA
jgi:hypothetical protein